jgi:hypothetical protein
MSAVFILPQSRSVHMITDAVSYFNDGLIQGTNISKAKAIPTMSMAISLLGPANFVANLAEFMQLVFNSFDEFINAAEEWLPQAFNQLAQEHRQGDAMGGFYCMGWSDRDDKPAVYTMNLWTEGSTRYEQVIANSRKAGNSSAVEQRLQKMTTLCGPLPPENWRTACGWENRRNDDYVPAVDLLHLLEIARHEQIEGKYWVGGKALLTSIEGSGLITQKVVHHWEEDVKGEYIRPRPINWKAWRAEREGVRAAAAVEASGVDLSGLSRLQRERMLKKAKKGTLRVVS